MFDDACHVFMPVDRWNELKVVFKSDWPRSLSAFTLLETEEYFLETGCDYGFKVYCPFGNVNNGLVALNIKDTMYEVIIQFPKDNTAELENALRNTKIVDWSKCNEIPFVPINVTDCLVRLCERKEINCKLDELVVPETFILDKDSPPFDVRLTSGFSFKHLTLDNVQLVNDTWPHKYPGSDWYYSLLIKAKLGYGLFDEEELLGWVFIKEMGALGHLYTLEKHRKKGYGELILKLISNLLLKNNKYVVAYCVKGNRSAVNLYMKLGFEYFENAVTFITANKAQ